jgi:heme exporter protein A
MKLIADNLDCERGGRTVFQHLSFSAASGQLLLLKGRNGAGKTSLVRIIAGLGADPRSALRLEGGHDDLTIPQQCHFIAHQNAIKPSLTVAENLAFWTGFSGGGDVTGALAEFALDDLAPFSAALLSAGQKRRLALARLAAVPRPIWLLDEPTVGLDAASIKRLGRLMTGHLATGGLILATTHVDIGITPSQVFDFDTLGQEAA